MGHRHIGWPGKYKEYTMYIGSLICKRYNLSALRKCQKNPLKYAERFMYIHTLTGLGNFTSHQ